MNFYRISQYASGLACAVLIQSPALAADPAPSGTSLCAVSGFNAKIEAGGGYYKDNSNNTKGGRLHAAGSVALPLSCVFGLQFDGAIGALDGRTAGGGAIHAFARDPSSYLLGGYGEYSVVGNNDIWRFGGEAEAYWGQITFSALAGYEDSDLTNSDVFAAIDLSFYATDNFRISGGYRRFLDIDAAAVGAEWQFDNTPFSVFTEGQVGSNKYLSVVGGVRFHFGGPQKSLIRRNREDDPFNRLTQLIRRVAPPAAAPGGGEGGGEFTVID